MNRIKANTAQKGTKIIKDRCKYMAESLGFELTHKSEYLNLNIR